VVNFDARGRWKKRIYYLRTATIIDREGEKIIIKKNDNLE
jgi:hypothetical protein